MRKSLACTLSLALLLSLTACHKPQAEQLDNSQPDNSAATSTQADVSIPEPDNAPAPEPPKVPVPEQLSDTIPAAPAENEDPQDQAEPDAQEATVQEPVKTETPKQTAPKTTDNPPAETKPAEQAQEPQAQQQSQEPQSSGLTPEMEEHNRQMREQAEQQKKQEEQKQEEQQKQGTGEHGYSTREWTDEEAKRATDMSGKIYRGEEQLQQAEDGTFYFYY